MPSAPKHLARVESLERITAHLRIRSSSLPDENPPTLESNDVESDEDWKKRVGEPRDKLIVRTIVRGNVGQNLGFADLDSRWGVVVRSIANLDRNEPWWQPAAKLHRNR